MKKLKYLLLLCLPFNAEAQDRMRSTMKTENNRGIRFEKQYSWRDVLSKAKQQRKFIFVDCYATWCGPCKIMDSTVYVNDTVGYFMNKHFISVKLQMDSTKNDGETVRQNYALARDLEDRLNVNSLPAYLFFSPDGKAVHKETGSKTVMEFLDVVKSSLDPQQQYYTQVENWRKGEADYKTMPALIRKLGEFDEKELLKEIGSDYLRNYLNKLPEKELINKERLQLIESFASVITSRDNIFQAYLNKGPQIDSIMNYPGYAYSYVCYVITREEIVPRTETASQSGKNPDWDEINGIIRKKYGSQIAALVIISAKVNWYAQKKDWKNHFIYLEQEIEMKDVDNIPASLEGLMYLNNNAWNVFLYSDDRELLEKALKWSDRAIGMDPKLAAACMDTKACLLYKLGRKQEAIELEQKVLEASGHKERYRERVEKMKRGEAIWLSERDE